MHVYTSDLILGHLSSVQREISLCCCSISSKCLITSRFSFENNLANTTDIKRLPCTAPISGICRSTSCRPEIRILSNSSIFPEGKANAALGSVTSPPLTAPPLGKTVIAEPLAGTNGTSNTYNLYIGGKAYQLPYQITGTDNKLNNITTEACAFDSCPRNKLNNVSVERDNTTLLVNIVAQSNGKLTIELPRNLIDSKEKSNIDKPYLLWEGANY
jgi:hypothetical protein